MNNLQDAQAVLADPDFDVEEFVKNINIHYQNKQIVKSLGGHANIVLGLIETGDYRFLEIMPEFINVEIFEQIKKDGYEVWARHKKTENAPGYGGRKESHWFGVVINDELCIHYRRLGHWSKYSSDFKVHKGPGAAEKMRKKWKGVLMLPVGEESKKEILSVYLVRPDLWDWVENNLGMKKGYSAKNHKRSDFRWHHQLRQQQAYSRGRNNRPPRGTSRAGRGARAYLELQLLQSGKDCVRVKVSCDTQDALVSHTAKSKKNQWNASTTVSFGQKFLVKDPHLLLKIMNWASLATKDNKEFRDNVFRMKIEALIKQAGLE